MTSVSTIVSITGLPRTVAELIYTYVYVIAIHHENNLYCFDGDTIYSMMTVPNSNSNYRSFLKYKGSLLYIRKKKFKSINLDAHLHITLVTPAEVLSYFRNKNSIIYDRNIPFLTSKQNSSLIHTFVCVNNILYALGNGIIYSYNSDG